MAWPEEDIQIVTGPAEPTAYVPLPVETEPPADDFQAAPESPPAPTAAVGNEYDPPLSFDLPADFFTPWDQPIHSAFVSGPFDCWAGQVLKVRYAESPPSGGIIQAVEVERAAVRWGANNEPAASSTAPAFSAPVASIVTALPWPARHDQQLHHVAVGDIVSVLSGRDGRHWFLSDDLPFPAVVVKPNGASAKEANVGGAGLLSLRVRRQAISGNPASAPPVLADLLKADNSKVEIANVLVIAPTTRHHGYRCGDRLWVTRRGLYYFALPAPTCFPGYIVDQGPEAEADPSDNKYWVREYDASVTAAGNGWTYTKSPRTQTDPTGSGGRFGRHVLAENVAEVVTSHELPVDEALPVIVTMFADPATGVPFYQFTRPLPPEPATALGITRWYDIGLEGSKTITVDAGDWRGRFVTVDWAYAYEPFDEMVTGYSFRNHEVLTAAATGAFTLFQQSTGLDIALLWIDGDDGGKLKLTLTDFQANMHIAFHVQATAVIDPAV